MSHEIIKQPKVVENVELKVN